MTRTCARPACREAAVATLSYAYDTRAVWVEPLAAEAHPMTHDLCSDHARDIRVPVGWTSRDLRDASLDDDARPEASSDGRLFADRISA